MEPRPRLWRERRRSAKSERAPEERALLERVEPGGCVGAIPAHPAVFGKGCADLVGPRVPLRAAVVPLGKVRLRVRPRLS